MLREWKMNNCMKKNLSFGIGFTVDLKIWISQVDLSYACADPEGYGGPDHLENQKFYRFQLKLAFGPHTPWKNLDPPPLKNDRPLWNLKKIIVFLKINYWTPL